MFPTSGWMQTLKTGSPQGSLKREKAMPHNEISPALQKKQNFGLLNTFRKTDEKYNPIEKNSPESKGLKINVTSTKNTTSLDSVLFMRPQGYFFSSLMADYSSYYYYFIFGPAFTSSYWRNLSGDAISYNWTLPDPDGEIDDSYGYVLSTVNSTDSYPEAYYPYTSFYSNPSLTASDGKYTLSYTLGGADSTIIFTGGSSLYSLETGVCNYDYHKNMYAYYYDDGEFLFGSSTADDAVDAVANFFEKPAHTYVLDSIWINAPYCTAPAGTEFKLIIHKIDEEGYLTDTIATATTTIEDVLGPYNTTNNLYYTLVFSDFTVYDDELGFDVTQDYLEIDDAILMELNGFNNNDNITFSVLAQQFNTSPVNENNAYIFVTENDERYITSYNDNTSLSFNLGLIYSYLFADSDTFQVSSDGGSKTFDVTTYFNPDHAMWTEEEIPDWLDFSYDFDEDTWKMKLQITADALPEGTTERQDSVTIATYGSKFTFYVYQNDVDDGSDEDDGDSTSSLNTTLKNNFYLINQNGEIYASYPQEYNELTMFDITGRIVEKHTLPTTGNYSFIPSVTSYGTIYLFRLTGKDNQYQTFKLIY